jgi:hypothetical protein
MSRFNCVIVEICDADHKEAKKLVDVNKDLGYRIYKYRGTLLTILVTENTWRSPDSEFIAVADGLYVWRGDKFEKV